MDKELAGAVLRRWDEGLPVAETMLYKAAKALGVDPQDALEEARFQTYAGHYFSKHAELDRAHRIFFSAAAGIPLDSMEKSAFEYRLSPDELIVEALRERNWVPDLGGLHKLANLGAPDPLAPPGDTPPNDMSDPSQQDAMGAAMGMQRPPQQGAMVQQPGFKPSPTAPSQVPPSADGNLDALLQSQQQTFGQGAMDNGGLPPSGMPTPPPEPPTPEERIQQVGPNLDPETTQRYAEQLTRFEEGFGMAISDPKQMVKFVKELQKVDGKRIDQGIKAMGQQLEQEQAQELGVDGGTPTIDGGTGGPQVMAPKSPGDGGEEAGQGGPPAPQQAQQGGPPQQPKKPPQQPGGMPGGGGKPPASPMAAAAEKVAAAARRMAQARRL